jgi:serine/threonine-protein kinase
LLDSQPHLVDNRLIKFSRHWVASLAAEMSAALRRCHRGDTMSDRVGSSPSGVGQPVPVNPIVTTDDADRAFPGAEAVAGSRPDIPGYEILEELGRGMGVVYKARQLKANRLVALKMILAGGHATPAERQRFQTEAEAVARLQHPHIVQVFEVGDHQGLPFFSMEFCEGGSLAARLAATPLPPQEAAALVEDVAGAVHFAHEHRILHRDLKPGNILRTADGTPKVTDFGLAKRLDEASQTASGAVLGTPSYMAPEQASGRKMEVGERADVYALGATLYECLTGRPPFKAATALDTLLQVVSEEPVPPRQLNARLPTDMESPPAPAATTPRPGPSPGT